MPKAKAPRAKHKPKSVRPQIGATQPKDDNPHRIRIQWFQPEGPGTRIGGTVMRLPGDTPELVGRMLGDIAGLFARSFATTEADLPALRTKIMDAMVDEIKTPTCDERGARSA